MSSLIEALGTERVLEPLGALPQAALRLDATLQMQRYEIELDVDTLCLDSTSFRQLVEAHEREPHKIAEAILRIVSDRGKMHNPVTGPGGIPTGLGARRHRSPDRPLPGLRPRAARA